MRKTGLRWGWLAGAGALLVAAIGLVTVTRSARAADEGGYLGVYTQSMTSSLREGIGYNGDGALVNRVVDGSPADRAGLRKGDVIVRYNNRLVDDAADLTDLVRGSRPGQRVALLVHRDGSNRQINVTLGEGSSTESGSRTWSWNDDDEDNDSGHGRVWIERDGKGDDDDGDVKVYRYEGKGGKPQVFRFKDKDGDPDVIVPRIMTELHGLEGLDELKDLNIEIPRMVVGRARLGVQLQDLNEGLGEYFETDKGALVTSVVDGSAADKAGFKAGDVITRFDGKDVEDSEDLMRAVRGADEGPVDVTVIRKGRTETLRPTLEKRNAQAWSWSNDRTREQVRGLAERARERAERARERADRARERVDRLHSREMRNQDQDVRREMERLREELRELQRKLDRMQEDGE